MDRWIDRRWFSTALLVYQRWAPTNLISFRRDRWGTVPQRVCHISYFTWFKHTKRGNNHFEDYPHGCPKVVDRSIELHCPGDCHIICLKAGQSYCWLVGGDWNMFYFFHSVGNVIIPIDEVILFRGVCLTTNHQPVELLTMTMDQLACCVDRLKMLQVLSDQRRRIEMLKAEAAAQDEKLLSLGAWMRCQCV